MSWAGDLFQNEQCLFWEKEFHDYLHDTYNFAERTIIGHLRMLKCAMVREVMMKNFKHVRIERLDHKTALYQLQSKICLEGYKDWKDIWTAIEYLRLWKHSKYDDEPTEEQINSTVMSIVNDQKSIQKEIMKCIELLEQRLQKCDNFNLCQSHTCEEIDDQKNTLIEWQYELEEREKDLMFRFSRMIELAKQVREGRKARRKKAGVEYLRNTLSEEDVIWLKQRTIELHKKENIGKTNRLLFLMIVMRDNGFLIQEVDTTGFLRLMVEWGILSEEDIIHGGAVMTSFNNKKEDLPKRGKLSYKSEEWNAAYMKDYKADCERLAKYFER